VQARSKKGTSLLVTKITQEMRSTISTTQKFENIEGIENEDKDENNKEN